MVEAVYHRVFQLWAYNVGMSQLLLRSNQSSGVTTRVDIGFQGVSWLELPTYLQGVTIERDVPEDLKELEERGISIGDRHLFSLSGVDYRGLVVAHLLKMVEDDKDYLAPSSVFVG
ncbi:MAG TPA: hypothetical protein VE983_07145 [Solirubrobacteraceae bacterium]|nr:hypothetical protein [Solirubrobacteraceae bacterium]